MIDKRKKQMSKKSIAAMLVALGITSATMMPVLADDMDSYSLQGVEVVAQREPEPVEETPIVEPVAEPAPEVYAGGQVARTSSMGILGKKDIMDVPFNVTSYTSKTIEDTQAQNLSDVLINDPSVSSQSGNATSSGNWNIRGFGLTSQDVSINGLYGVSPAYGSDLSSIERVEVLKGPSALLNGMSPNGAVGGSVNLVTKRAEDKPLTKLSLTYGNGSQFGQSIDVGRRFGDDKKFGVRFNASNVTGDTATDREHNDVKTAALALDAKGDNYRASLDLGYFHQKATGLTAPLKFTNKLLAQMTAPPAVWDNTFNFGAPGTYIDTTEKYGLFHGEYDLNDKWTAYASAGVRRTKQDYVYNAFRLDVGGKITINSYAFPKEIQANTQELGVRGEFQTGGIKHNLTVAATRLNLTTHQYSKFLGSYSFNDMYHPTWTPIVNTFGTSNLPKTNETTLTGIAISDVLSTKDDAWQFIIGGRHQNVETTSYNQNTRKQTSHYDESAFSPAFGIVHKFNKNVSAYANYIEGLQKGSTVNDAEAPNNGQTFEPYKTKQHEVGVKIDSGKFTTTLSAFEIKLPSLIQNQTTKVYSLDGEIRNRGIEVNVFGEPTKGTRILGGMMFLNAKYAKTNAGTLDGNQLEAVPRFTAVLGLEKDIPSVDGLTLTTRAVYNGSSYLDPDNNVRVSPWLRWDVGARYTFNKESSQPLTLRADIYNVFNKKYWEARSYGVSLGDSRTYSISLSTEF